MKETSVAKFEDLIVWKEAMNFVVSVYNKFKLCKDYGLKDQIQRAAVSIPSNIAEGYERKTDKEFVQFLYIAKASCGEVRTQIYLALKLDYLSKNDGSELLEQSKKISSMLYKLIQYRTKE
ncbi:MAG: four helix bundle protein [Candidatus Azobacteroides sp.]|nr:four helix bundle protein [Candidatus Azobacteroides sp.]